MGPTGFEKKKATPNLEDGIDSTDGSVVNWPMVIVFVPVKDRVVLDPFQMAVLFAEINGDDAITTYITGMILKKMVMSQVSTKIVGFPDGPMMNWAPMVFTLKKTCDIHSSILVGLYDYRDP